VTHYTEDDLILYYYGEARRRADIEQHLGACGDCATAYRQLAGTLSLVVAPEIPDRDDRYGLEVWQRIRHQMPLQETPPWTAWATWTAWFRADRLALAGAAAVFLVVLLAAFVAGRLWQQPAAERPNGVQAADASNDAGTRVRLAAISDHLERSERVLLDVVNAGGARIDVSDAQAWAADLVDANRLYRQAAIRDGDTMVADVLDELERNLLEIVHGPSTLTPAQLDQLRVRLDAAALLFKVRVLHDELRERETAPAPPRKTT